MFNKFLLYAACLLLSYLSLLWFRAAPHVVYATGIRPLVCAVSCAGCLLSSAVQNSTQCTQHQNMSGTNE